MKKLAILISLLGLLTACTQDSYDGFIGLWENNERREVIEIKKDGNTYLAIFDILKDIQNKDDQIVLSKSEGQLSINYTFAHATLGLIDSGNTLMIADEQFSRINLNRVADIKAEIAEEKQRRKLAHQERMEKWEMEAKERERKRQEQKQKWAKEKAEQQKLLVQQKQKCNELEIKYLAELDTIEKANRLYEDGPKLAQKYMDILNDQNITWSVCNPNMWN